MGGRARLSGSRKLGTFQPRLPDPAARPAHAAHTLRASRPLPAAAAGPPPQVGVPSEPERIAASLAAARAAAPTVRAFLAYTAETRADVMAPDAAGADGALLKALGEVEAARGGAPLRWDDAKGMAELRSKVAALAAGMGLPPPGTSDGAALAAAYAASEAADAAAFVRASADEAVARAEKADGEAGLPEMAAH